MKTHFENFDTCSIESSEAVGVNAERVEIAVIDGSLDDWEVLRDGLRPGMEVALIGADEDGLQRLAAMLRFRRGIEAIHILSHGFPGGFSLGSAVLDATTLARHVPALKAVGDSLSDDADILIYSCETARGTGETLLSAIAGITGANVAGSYNLTGAPSGDCDWRLGFQTAPIAACSALTGTTMAAYRHTLTTAPLFDSITGNSDSGVYLASANLSASFSTGADPVVLTDVALDLIAADPTDGGTLTVVLAADNAGSPGVTIATLGTVADSALSSVSPGETPVDVRIQAGPTLAAGTRYWIGLEQNGSSAEWVTGLLNSGTGVSSEAFFIGAFGNTPPTSMTFQNSAGDVAEMQVDASIAPWVITEGLSHDTGKSASDLTTFDPTLSGTATPFAVVALTEGGSSVGVATADSNGAWSFTPGLLDGTHTIVATDSVTAATASLTFTLDTVPPSDPTITSAALTNVVSPTITGTGEADGVVTIVVDSVGYTTVADSNGAWSLDLATATPDNPNDTLLLDTNGVNTILAIGTDTAGNSSGLAVQSLVIDTTPPAAPLIRSSALTNSVTPVISGSAEAGAIIHVVVDGVGYTITADGGGAWSLDLGTAAPDNPSQILTLALNAGNPVTATATDAAGNVSVVTTQILSIDTAPAATPVITSAALTNNARPVINGSAGGNDVITVGVDGVNFTVQADAGGAWSLDLRTATPDNVSDNLTLNVNGSNTITAIATNTAGNTSSQALQTLVIDTTPPTAPVFTSAELTNNANPIITGTGDAFSVTTVVVNGVSYTVTGDSSGAWSLTPLTATPDNISDVLSLNLNGGNTVTAIATDAAGNQSAPTTETLTIDTTPPPALTITSAALTNSAAPVITGNAEANTTIIVDVAGAHYSVRAGAGGAWTLDLGSATPTTGALALALNGNNPVNATATDGAGNVSSASQVLTIDTTPPSVPAITSAALTLNPDPVISGDAEAGSTVTLIVGGATYIVTADGSGVWSVDLASATPTSGTLAINPNGSNPVVVTATDAAGNVSGSATQTLTIDTTPPSTPSITSAALTNSVAPVIAGIADAGSLLTITVGGATYIMFADGSGNWSVDLGSATPSSGALALDLNGANAVSVVAADAAGNLSANVTQTLTIDTTSPPAPTITSAALTNNAAPVIAGTAEAGTTVTVVVGGATYTADAAGGLWSIDLASATPDSGSLALSANVTVVATARDAAGNASAAAIQTLTIDTTAPAAPVITSAAITNIVAPVITGSAETGATVTVVVGGATYTMIADGAGAWSVDLASATPVTGVLALNANGDNAVAAIATDLAGNVSSNAVQTLRIDTTAPARPVITSPDLTDVATPVIAGTAEVGAVLTVVVGGASYTAIADGAGRWNVNLASATPASGVLLLDLNGVNPVTVTARDAAGNASPGATQTLTIDTTAPDAPIDLLLDPASDSGVLGDNRTSDTTPTITGRGTSGDTITLFDGVTAIGSATVDGNGNWSVMAAAMSSGPHALTATATDAAGNISVRSAQLALAIDGTVVTSTTFKLGGGAGALSMGIVPPSSSLFRGDQLTITVAALPDNGVVTLSNGTAVTVGQVLGSGELTGLLFTPTSGLPGTTSAFVYTVTDPQSNADTGTITLTTGFSGRPDISTNGPVSNTGQPHIQGTAAPGTQVTLLNNGVAIGTSTADGDGNFAIQPETPLPLGLARLTVSSVLPDGTTTASAPLVEFIVQSPVAGISTTNFSSADIGAALNQGAHLSFLPGTEAVQMVDATLSVGADTGEATIQRLYEGLLGRSSDSAGISGWDDMLLSGTSKSAIAAGLLTSAEYTGGHAGTPTNLQFVDGLYTGLLGRTADAAGEASWIHQLAAGASRGAVTVGVADSDEAKAHLADSTAALFVPHAVGTALHEMFETGLGREIELPALSQFNSAFNGSGLSLLAAAIAAAPEFLARHGFQDNTAYVSDLYQHGLGRSADQGGLTAWTQALDDGSLSRGGVLLGIATSSEAAGHLTFNLAG